MKTFFGGYTKKGLHDLCGSNLVGKSRTKNFSDKFEKIRVKILLTPKICLLLHLCSFCNVAMNILRCA